MSKAKPSVGQIDLFKPPTDLSVPAEFIPTVLPEGFDLDQRVTFSHFVAVIAAETGLPPDYTNEADLTLVTPDNIATGLGLGTHGVAGRNPNSYMGIGFTATQKLKIPRSPAGLADHAYSSSQTTDEKRKPGEHLSRDEVRATASRAAGHTLVGKITKLDELITDLTEREEKIWRMSTWAGNPERAARAGLLDELRLVTDVILQECVEIAAVSHRWADETAEKAQRALQFNLYGHPGRNDIRLRRRSVYLRVARAHNHRQLEVTSATSEKAERELGRFKPFLEAKQEDE